MALRQTRKAGLVKPRIEDAQLRQAFDAIIERLEVLDGLRGDSLDQAVTWRALGDSGFTLGTGAGGAPLVTNTPGPGDGTPAPDTTGPAAAPTGLTAAETWLAILLTWDNPPLNLQFIEIWRNDIDDITSVKNGGTCQRIATSRVPLYVDYVGAEASYYYWIRAVGTDGSYSAYYDPDPGTAIIEGVLGTTGVDPSQWEANANFSADALDALLNSRIDLIDNPTTGLVDRVNVAYDDIADVEGRTTQLEAGYTYITGSDPGELDLANFISAQSSYNEDTTATVGEVSGELGDLVGFVGDTTGLPAGWGSTVVDAIQTSSSNIQALESSIGALDSEGGEEWDFADTTLSWTSSNITLTPQGTALKLEQDGTDPQFISPTISLTGGIFTQVVARIRLLESGGGWDGRVHYTTAAHGFSNSYYKAIPDPSFVLTTQWQTLTWDMTDLTAGGDDWQNSTITQIRLELGSGTGGKYEVDWVIIAKFSVTAQAEALDALTTRVIYVEGDGGLQMVGAQSTRLTTLESSITGKADASITDSLTADVLELYNPETGEGIVIANANAITALEATVDNEELGVLASAGAISDLETDVRAIYNDEEGTGLVVAQASSITQLSAQLTGGFSSVVNPFTTAGEGFGSTVADSDVQAYNGLGGLDGVAALIATTGNVQKYIYRSDGNRLFVEPYGIYEIKFRVYHGRQNDQGSFYFGLNAYNSLTDDTKQSVDVIRDGAAVSTSNNPYWFSVRAERGDDEWLDVTCYLLGDSVDPSRCSDMLVNGATYFTGASIFNDGHRTKTTGQYVEFRVLNYNSSPTYGDGTNTTVYFTNFTVQRIDAAAEFQAVVQEETSVLTNSVGDINATYAVRAELNAGGDPYVVGFGLMADVVNGTASSAFGIRADQFFVQHPNASTDAEFPFIIDTVDGEGSEIGINGTLIVDGTIRAESLIAGSIGADYIGVNSLSALTANMGTLAAGLLTTKGTITGTNPNGSPIYGPDTRDGAWRVEIEADSAWPIWYGQGGKSEPTGLFYVTTDGNVVVKGLLDAGMIKQSYFTPAGANNSFRIACDYPSNYSAGIYTGKSAHLSPTRIMQQQPDQQLRYNESFNSNAATFYSPTYSSSIVEFARLGSSSETILLQIFTDLSGFARLDEFDITGYVEVDGFLQYQYDNEGWKSAWSWTLPINFTAWSGAGGSANRYGSASSLLSQHFVTRGTSFSTLKFRLRFENNLTTGESGPATPTLENISLTATTPNFGVSTRTVGDVTASGASVYSMPEFPRFS